MRKIILGLSLLTLISSCKFKNYKYRIEGNVMVNDTLYPAIWYTDTISFDNDTDYYYNSDSSEVRIYPPFTIQKNTK